MLAAIVPSAAGAATIIGETPGQQAELITCSDLEGVQDASGAGAPSYEVPADGVITSFRHRAGEVPVEDRVGDAYADRQAGADADGDQVIRMKTWRRTANPAQFTVAGASAPELLTPNALNEFDTRVPVRAGDLLGLTTLTSGVSCAFSGVAGDHHFYDFSSDLPVGGTIVADNGVDGNRWNIEATVEPDADRDGYGDETQDACPADASTQGPCPPNTWIRFRPKFKHFTHSRFRFISTLKDSTFTCQMDDEPATACVSPIDYPRLKPGKHTFTVFATAPSGVDDPTPEVVKFKVRRHR